MAFKIYTRTGDKGQTSLFGGKRLPKHHLRIETYGTVDELNAYIGLLRDYSTEEDLKQLLKQIQDTLFTIGSNLATDIEKKQLSPLNIQATDIELLERQIDAMEAELPPLKNFILPGGHPVVSFCHVARCVCRRTERLVVHLDELEGVEPILIQYLNRLSDYLFVLARKLGKMLHAEEVLWTPRQNQ